MRRLISIAAVLLCSYVLATPSYAQKAAETVKPAASPSQTVLDQWNDIGRKLVAMAEDFPDDKYDFKPNPAERTFAEQLLHASGVNYFFTNVVLGEKPAATEKSSTRPVQEQGRNCCVCEEGV